MQNKDGDTFATIGGKLYTSNGRDYNVYDDELEGFIRYDFSVGDAVQSHASTTYHDEIIKVGGRQILSQPVADLVQSYNPITNRSTRYPLMTQGRILPGAITLNGKLYVMGGEEVTKGVYGSILNSMESLQLGDPNEIYATGISMNQGTARLDADVQQTLQLQANIAPVTTWDQRTVWTSTNPLVASVDENGLVTALSGGETRITATTVNGGYSAVCYITVDQTIVNAESITITPDVAELEEGETLALSAAILPANTTDQIVTWTSSDDAVATIDTNGVVTAVTPGQATITAATHNGLTASSIVTIIEPVVAVSGVSVTPASYTMDMGEDIQLDAQVIPANATNQAVTWSSSNTAVVDVDSDGLVTAIAEGVATITATTVDGGYTDSCVITIESAATVDVNLALGATATASSVHNNNNNANGAQNAIDGDEVSRWLAVASEMTSYLEIDFGSEVTFNSIEVEHMRIGQYELEYYDGFGWTTFYTDELTNRDAIDISFASITASKIRINLYSKYGAATNGYQITEFRVFHR